MSDSEFYSTFIMGMACATILWMGVFAWAFMRAPRSTRRTRSVEPPKPGTYTLWSGDKDALPVGPEERRWFVLKQRNRKNRVTKSFGEDV